MTERPTLRRIVSLCAATLLAVASPCFAADFYLRASVDKAGALRLAWEATILTAREGGQMVGFALLHSGAIIPLGLSALFALVWVPTAIVWLSVLAVKGRRPAAVDWAQLALIRLPLVILHIIPANT